MSSNQFVSALAYCRDNMDRPTYTHMHSNINNIRMDTDSVRRAHKLHAFVYQRLLFCLQKQDLPTFVELLQ